MPTQFISGQVMEVALPADYEDATCLPTVILQPTADNTNYMLKSTYATNGEPGVVDHAVLADTIEVLPRHGVQHLSDGDDPIPTAIAGLDGLMPAGNGVATDYYGGDCQQHPLPALASAFSEGTVNMVPSQGPGAILFAGIIPNLQAGVYIVEYPYFYNPSAVVPLGTVHLDVYDPVAAAWVTVTASTDLSVMTSPTVLVRPFLLSVAMTRVFQASANALNWRLVLDTPGGITSSFQVGFRFSITGLQSV